jgi:hypothetical protein
MDNTEFRDLDVIEVRRLTRPGFAAAEPSHIHIPRPSRRRVQTVVSRRDDAAPLARLELPLEEAA